MFKLGDFVIYKNPIRKKFGIAEIVEQDLKTRKFALKFLKDHSGNMMMAFSEELMPPTKLDFDQVILDLTQDMIRLEERIAKMQALQQSALEIK